MFLRKWKKIRKEGGRKEKAQAAIHRVGLESIHGFDLFLLFANKGTLRRKQEGELRNQAGCLNLVTNAVVTWNTVYMAAVIEQLRAEGRTVNDKDIARLSPARYEHINPYGKYRFEVLHVLEVSAEIMISAASKLLLISARSGSMARRAASKSFSDACRTTSAAARSDSAQMFLAAPLI